MYAKKEKINPAYVSKQSSNREKQVILLIIPNREEWHFLAAQKRELREITSKHQGNFFCLNCLYSFTTESKRESHKKVYENKDFCSVVMPSNNNRKY